jgi:hypothetical protein
MINGSLRLHRATFQCQRAVGCRFPTRAMLVFEQSPAITVTRFAASPCRVRPIGYLRTSTRDRADEGPAICHGCAPSGLRDSSRPWRILALPMMSTSLSPSVTFISYRGLCRLWQAVESKSLRPVWSPVSCYRIWITSFR